MNMDMGTSFVYDGMLHWCFLISISGFGVAMLWVFIRILLPLLRLVKQAEGIIDGNLPTFENTVGGIPEIDRLRGALRYMIQQIKVAKELEAAYRKALTESQEYERMRIARDIHDDTIQSLVLVSHQIERATKAQANDDHPVLVKHLEGARQQLLLTVDSLRQMIANLRPTILDELGLATAVEVLCEKHPTLEFNVTGEPYGVEHAQELAIFRAAQELTLNAERHAHADQIHVTLAYSPAAVILEVRDDGVGFEIPTQIQSLAGHGHYGLIGISERITHLGGDVRLVSQPNGGTCITVTVPVSKPTSARTSVIFNRTPRSALGQPI